MKKAIRDLQKKFIGWKHKLNVLPDLSTDRWGRFNHSGVQREWAAYLECISQNLPIEPPQEAIDAIIAKGVRPDWAADVYKALRKALLDK